MKFEEKKKNFTSILMAILDLDTEPGPHYGKLLNRKRWKKFHLTFTTNIKNVFNSVPDPEPYVFGAPVSESTTICTDPVFGAPVSESTTICTDPDPYLYPSNSNQKTKVNTFFIKKTRTSLLTVNCKIFGILVVLRPFVFNSRKFVSKVQWYSSSWFGLCRSKVQLIKWILCTLIIPRYGTFLFTKHAIGIAEDMLYVLPFIFMVGPYL